MNEIVGLILSCRIPPRPSSLLQPRDHGGHWGTPVAAGAPSRQPQINILLDWNFSQSLRRDKQTSHIISIAYGLAHSDNRRWQQTRHRSV